MFDSLFDGGFATVALLVAVVVLYVGSQWQRIRKELKGPWGVPLLGYVPFMTDEPYKDFVKLSKKYGDIFSIRLGSRTVIVINGYESLKECLVKNGDIFTRRAVNSVIKEVGDQINILVTNGEIWKEQRRFHLSAMRDFGFGTQKMEANISEELKITVAELRKRCGKPVDFSPMFITLTCNVISYLAFGRRFGYDEQEILNVLEDFDKFGSAPMFYSPVVLFPVLLKMIPKSLVKALKHLLEMKRTFYSFVDKIKHEHEKTFDENSMRDIVDMFVQKQHKLDKDGGNSDATIYSDNHLRANSFLLFGGGTHTTAATLSWTVKLLAAHPSLQKQLQEEVDDVIGGNRPPAMADRLHMPSMEAFSLEVHRYVSLVPLLLTRRTTRDVKVGDVEIPEGSLFMVNLWSVHNDEQIWDKPEEFNPGRFLEADKRISNKLRDHVIPFAIGKRNCLGESLARMELFIAVATLLQHFTFHPPDNERLTLECHPLMARTLKSCTLHVTSRG